jgi:hypothetical protein
LASYLLAFLIMDATVLEGTAPVFIQWFTLSILSFICSLSFTQGLNVPSTSFACEPTALRFSAAITLYCGWVRLPVLCRRITTAIGFLLGFLPLKQRQKALFS